MATKKNDASTDRSNTKQSGKKQNASAADFDKLAKEAEMDSPRSRKPGSSSGNHSEQHNNGRGGGK